MSRKQYYEIPKKCKPNNNPLTMNDFFSASAYVNQTFIEPTSKEELRCHPKYTKNHSVQIKMERLQTNSQCYNDPISSTYPDFNVHLISMILPGIQDTLASIENYEENKLNAKRKRSSILKQKTLNFKSDLISSKENISKSDKTSSQKLNNTKFSLQEVTTVGVVRVSSCPSIAVNQKVTSASNLAQCTTDSASKLPNYVQIYGVPYLNTTHLEQQIENIVKKHMVMVTRKERQSLSKLICPVLRLLEMQSKKLYNLSEMRQNLSMTKPNTIHVECKTEHNLNKASAYSLKRSSTKAMCNIKPTVSTENIDLKNLNLSNYYLSFFENNENVKEAQKVILDRTNSSVKIKPPNCETITFSNISSASPQYSSKYIIEIEKFKQTQRSYKFGCRKKSKHPKYISQTNMQFLSISQQTAKIEATSSENNLSDYKTDDEDFNSYCNRKSWSVDEINTLQTLKNANLTRKNINGWMPTICQGFKKFLGYVSEMINKAPSLIRDNSLDLPIRKAFSANNIPNIVEFENQESLAEETSDIFHDLSSTKNYSSDSSNLNYYSFRENTKTIARQHIMATKVVQVAQNPVQFLRTHWSLTNVQLEHTDRRICKNQQHLVKYKQVLDEQFSCYVDIANSISMLVSFFKTECESETSDPNLSVQICSNIHMLYKIFKKVSTTRHLLEIPTRSKTSQIEKSKISSEKIGDTKKRQKFKILCVKKINSNSILVKWSSPKNIESVTGFQIYVNSDLKCKLLHFRTCAVIENMEISQPFDLTIVACTSSKPPYPTINKFCSF